MKKNICLVTDELQDIPPCGGIGTATQHLALHLKKNRFDVSILYTGELSLQKQQEKFSYFKNYHEISLYFLKNNLTLDIDQSQKIMKHAVQTYEWFYSSPNIYDIILFHEYKYAGYYCLMLKDALPCFKNSILGITCHGSIAWCDDVNEYPLEDSYRLWQRDLEQSCIEMADFLFTPSLYLVNWMRDKGWVLPEEIRIIPYLIMPENNSWENQKCSLSIPAKEIQELVFFGRLEPRKGVDIFIQALELLQPEILQNRVVTFLGWDGIISHEILRNRVETLNLPIKVLNFINNYDALQARNYLRTHPALAIMPSPGDNSPCVVYECLADRIPFIASNLGGQQELIHPEDHHYSIASPHPPALARAIENVLKEEIYKIPRPSESLCNALQNSCSFFEEKCKEASQKQILQITAPLPLVSVIIPTFNRAGLLQEAVDSALHQDYQNIEIVIVNDGSTDPRVATALSVMQRWDTRIKIIQQENKYLGAARNNGVRHAQGEYVVFLDDDNRLFPEYVSTCLSACQAAKADCVVVGAMHVSNEQCFKHRNKQTWLGLGGGSKGSFKSFGLLKNIYGDACCLVSKDACIKHPFVEKYRTGHEDFLFFSILKNNNYQIIALPKPLFYYTVSHSSMLHTTCKYNNFKMHSKLYNDIKKSECISLAEIIYFEEDALNSEIWKLENDINNIKH